MQIFILDEDINKNAQMYCNKHVVKIITEICQVLCTVASQRMILPSFCYKPTHAHHPIVKWLSTSSGNWEYTVKMGLALYGEYQHRYNKPDKHIRNKMILDYCSKIFPYDNKSNITPFVKAFKKYPDLLSDKISVVNAYREFYKRDKLSFAKWTNRPIPYWVKMEE